MAEPYLSELSDIINRIEIPPEQFNLIQCKHFFSGAAAYFGGEIFMSISPAGFALKLNEDDCRDLMKRGGTNLRYFPKAPIKKGYVVLPEHIHSDVEVFSNLIRKSIAYIQS